MTHHPLRRSNGIRGSGMALRRGYLLEVRPGAPFVASLLLVAMPGAPSSFLLLLVRHLFLVAMHLLFKWFGVPRNPGHRRMDACN